MRYKIYLASTDTHAACSAPAKRIATVLALLLSCFRPSGRLQDSWTGDLFLQWDSRPMRVLFGDDPYASSTTYIVIQKDGSAHRLDVLTGGSRTRRVLRTKRLWPRS